MAYINNYARPNNPVRDITGTALAIEAIYAEQGSSSPTTHNLSQAELFALGVTPATMALIQTPLSQLCDKAWAVDVAPGASNTLQQTVAALIQTGIQDNSPSGHAAYQISTNVPSSGSLFAIVLSPDSPQQNTVVFLSYQVNGIEGDWTAHNTQNDWIGLFEDATFKVTFNLEVLIQIQIPPSAGPVFTVTTSENINTVNISPTNYVGDVETFFANLSNFFQDQPPIFQAPEGAIASQGSGLPVSLGDLTTGIGDISSAWLQASIAGFLTLAAVIQPEQTQPTQYQLYLKFGHPQDPAPIPVNAAVPTFPSLFSPGITTVAEAVADTSILVSGAQFPLPQATELHIGWLDTTSGNVTKSFVIWGPANATQNPPVTIPRTGASDGKNLITVKSLTPGASYSFAIQDQDSFTETPFTSPAVTFTTTSTEQVYFVLSLTSETWAVGSTNLTDNGTISGSVSLPATLAAGVYTLTATVGGAPLAQTALQIVAAGGQVPPTITIQGSLINPTTGKPFAYPIILGQSFTVNFLGFDAGSISLYLDSSGGTLLGTATSTGPALFSSTFTSPTSGVSIGDHVLFAQGASPTQTATAPIYLEMPPQ